MGNNLISKINILGAPILVIIGGLITWFIKSKKEELMEIEKRSLEKRIETYNTVLSPFIMLFSNTKNPKVNEKALELITSVEYRKASFNLMTFGSDELVTSYNDMMQGFFKGENDTDTKGSLKKFAQFLLSIRKDVYNKNTKLKDWDMLRFMIKDLDNYISI
jgi:hypothetical protein